MIRRNSQRLAMFACVVLALSGCAKGTNPNSATGSGAVSTLNAINAVKEIVLFTKDDIGPFVRPGPKLAVYATLYIAESGYLPVFSAMRGVNAQMKLHSTEGTIDNNTYTLMQEFGSVLSVDIPDLLNRSSDRARTLNEYVESLSNITTRATDKFSELETDIARLESERRAAQNEVNTIQKDINAALKDRDYAAAAAAQENLSEAQTKQSEAQVQLRLTQDISNTLEQLLQLSSRRLRAIDENRAVLIAGLGVVEVPGIEDLDILRTGERIRGSTTGGFFNF